MSVSYIGLDVSKLKLNFALKTDSGFKTLVIKNDVCFFDELINYLSEVTGSVNYHFCCESTGVYWEAFANFCIDKGYKISVINPIRIKNYSKVVMQRTKTDKADACMIADFCFNQKPELWKPNTEDQLILTALMRELDSLNNLHTQENNRYLVSHDLLKKSIKVRLDLIKRQIKQLTLLLKKHIKNSPILNKQNILLQSIPSIGVLTSAWLLSLFGDLSKFKSAKHAVSFVGLAPRHYQSGSSVRGRSHISKVGRSDIRKALYMPAMIAYSRLEIFKPFVDRLRASGKPVKVIIVALMRKLILYAYIVLKTSLPFCPEKINL